MGLFDKIRKSKKEEAKTAPTPKIRAVKKPRLEKTAPVPVERKISKKEFTQAHRFLVRPVVTEKSVGLTDKLNQYVFKVRKETNKSELKKIVQDLYGVKVAKINLINLPGKNRRLGRFVGYRPGFKKAIVFLAPGEKIDIITR
ncbi:MAG: 50S ribosomal protein L23 [Candidatus Portnoybacteria bacterium]|jgi:large subunit ribosomal protein L23|nr:50S ribosomal protein L23 [Candidatus Portnoybacteria bacterium]